MDVTRRHARVTVPGTKGSSNAAARSNCSGVRRMYECRQSELGKTPISSTAGARSRSGSTVRGRSAKRHAQRVRDGSFSGAPTTSAIP